MSRRWRLVVCIAAGLCLLAPTALASRAEIEIELGPPEGVVVASDHRCGPQDLPETGLQGDVPLADQQSGRAESGYNCGLALVGHTILDADGRYPQGNSNMAWAGDCAYVSGRGAVFGPARPEPDDGVAVVDVSDPANPRHVRTLRTPAAVAALETIGAIETPDRAVLVVGQYGNQSGPNKPMDIYDVTDCANPVLLETFTWPANIHNLTFSPNGRYVFATQPLQVLDIDPLFDDDPSTTSRYLGRLDDAIHELPFATGPTADVDDALPPEVRSQSHLIYSSHEAWPSADGEILYLGGQTPMFENLTIVDIGQWLARDEQGEPAGPVEILSHRSGRGHSVRTATVRDGDGASRRLLLHAEESVVGLAYGCLPEYANPVAGPAQPWLTDVTDPTNPVLITQFGLEINDPVNCGTQLQSGVNASTHYHDVDDPEDTTFAMVSMWNAGVRVFDIRDAERPVEVAYFNPGDLDADDGVLLDHAWGHVRWVPEKGHIWFATADGGFWVVEIEPQVREQLGLDDGEAPDLRHPRGRAGTVGLSITVTPEAISTDAYSCTIAAVQAPVS